MKKILITGGLGYVGSKLAFALEKAGYNVLIYDKPQDILNPPDLRRAIGKVDIVYHLAALANLKYTGEHPQETYDVNIEGTENIARICAEKRVLLNFASTCCIYGDPLEYPSRENGIINPTDVYAMSKATGEYIVRMWGLAKDLKYNIIRFGTVYGESTDKKMRADMCIQIFINKAIEGSKIEVTGNGSQNRNFIHIDDLVRGLVLITKKGIVNQIINLAGKERITINKIANYAQRLGAKEISYTFERKNDFHDQDVSTKKAKLLLDWEAKVKFDDGIKQMYDFYRNS